MRRNTSQIGLRKLCGLVMTILSFLTSVAKHNTTLTGRGQESSEFYSLFSDNVSGYRQVVLPIKLHIYIPSFTINVFCMARY